MPTGREVDSVGPYTLSVREITGVSVPFTLRVRVDADLKMKSRQIRRLKWGSRATISQIRIKRPPLN